MNFQGGLLRILFCAAWLSLTQVAFCTLALALDPTEQLSELNHTQWTVRDGAPTYIDAIVQGKDGLLWLGSEVGLFSFDGAKFQRLQLADGSRPVLDAIRSLAAVSEDLWIGMRLGGAFLLHDGKLTHYGVTDGLPEHSVMGFASRPDGTIWAQTTAGLYTLSSGKWKSVENDWSYPATTGMSIYVDARGTLWSLGPQGIFALPAGSHNFARTQLHGGKGTFIDIPGVGAAYDDGVSIRSLSGDCLPVSAKDLGDATGDFHPHTVDSDGGLWMMIRSENSLHLVRFPHMAESMRARQPIHPQDAQILKPGQSISGEAGFMFEDREHNIWISTTGGLDQFKANKLHSAVESISLAAPAMSINPRGEMRIGTSESMVIFQSPEAKPAVEHFVLPSHEYVSSLLADADGGVIMGQENGGKEYGILGQFRDGKYKPIAVPNPEHSLAVQALARDSTGALWMASAGDGLYRQDGSVWARNGGLQGLPDAVPLSLSSDNQRRLWMGYPDDQLFSVDSAMQVHRFDSSDGLLVGAVLAVTSTAKRVWVAGTGGIAVMTGERFYSLKNIDGTAFSNVSGIVEDQTGGVWLNGGDGVTHLAPSEVNAFIDDPRHRVKKEVFNFEDGLRGPAQLLRPLPTALLDGHGIVWFATTEGVYWIDPARIHRNTLAPTVLLQSATANGRTYLADHGMIRLPERTSGFEIDFTATSLSIPGRVRFRYKLEGGDPDWQDAGNRRQAYYTNVPPGDHQFRVIAANEDGLWNAVGATTRITIPPAFYQAHWFHALCVLAALIVLWQLYLTRIQQIRNQLRARLSERVDERERIARELHDTLLQSTQGLILMVQSLVGRLERSDSMRKEVEVVLDHADELLNEARDRVNDLRTTGVDTDLEAAITKFGSEFFIDKPMHLAITADGRRRTIAPAVADDIFRICREALINAVLHSGATMVTVRIDYDASEFRVRVKDDGCGIEAGVRNSGGKPRHFGLPGMRERTKRVGGTLTIGVGGGRGTEVELIVPSGTAYSKERRPKGWLLGITAEKVIPKKTGP